MKNTLILCALVFISNISPAQIESIVIFGNVGVENVNIQVLNTQYGTSSDQNGDYRIGIYHINRDVVLLYTCVGYEDAVMVIKPEQLQNDSLEISFKMKQENLMLDEVEITAEKQNRFSEHKYVLMDFEIYGDKFFILQRPENSYKKFRILVTNMLFDALDTIPVPEGIIAESLLSDCDEQCQMMARDSVYQIVENQGRYFFAYPTEKNYFMNVMRDCLFITDNWIYIQQSYSSGYYNAFYRLNVNDKQQEMLFSVSDMETMKEYYDEMSFYMRHKKKEDRLAPEGVWSKFIKTAFYTPSKPHLDKIGDTLYFFNHSNSVIERYDENLNLLGSCNIDYHHELLWRHTIYKDKSTGKFYTVLGTTLNEIDVMTGKIYPKVEANIYLNHKMIIHNGNLYSLKRRQDSGNRWISYINRVKL